MLGELPVSQSAEILCVVAKDVGESTIIVLTKTNIGLVILESLLEVNGDLSADFSKLVSWQSSSGAFAEEQVLSLSKAKVAILLQGLFVEVKITQWVTTATSCP